MTTPETNFLLHCAGPDSPAPALAAVDIEGHVDGLLFSLTLAQTYVNKGNEPIEVQYSFPLPTQPRRRPERAAADEAASRRQHPRRRQVPNPTRS